MRSAEQVGDLLGREPHELVLDQGDGGQRTAVARLRLGQVGQREDDLALGVGVVDVDGPALRDADLAADDDRGRVVVGRGVGATAESSTSAATTTRRGSPDVAAMASSESYAEAMSAAYSSSSSSATPNDARSAEVTAWARSGAGAIRPERCRSPSPATVRGR